MMGEPWRGAPTALAWFSFLPQARLGSLPCDFMRRDAMSRA